ncbi:MAG: excisionase family DNA-binding protein [Acidimicrobiia bacterium]|nr:excisionase family DNA-binding protein [Acidimicrobiia bacterium]
MSTVTLQEAADQLGVHYMTVYRYVRLGRLPATKVGGTWEVDPADLERLRRGHDRSVRPKHSADWTKRLEARLLEGDEAGAWGVIEAALAAGSAPPDIYSRLIGPALASIGQRWHDGELSIAREHLATSTVLRLIGRMGPRFVRKGRTKGTVVVTTPPGERHVIPSLMVSDFLRGAGYAVIDLGADVPVESLAEIVERVDGLVAVCVSSTRAGADRAIRRVIKSVRKAHPELPVLVGGASISDADHATTIGADGWAQDGPGAVALVLEASAKS